MSLIDAAFSRSRTVLSLLALVLIAGLFAYVTIAKEARPDIAVPNIYVSMMLKGISPEDADRLLVRPMESELRSIEGVKEMRSNAFQGGATVLLEFEAGFDADKAVVDVREKVDAAEPSLPEEVDKPKVLEINLSLLPIVVVTLGGEIPERTMLRLARNLQEKIEGISSVLEASIGGDRKERVEIIIDPLMLESYGINPAEVLSIIRRSTLTSPLRYRDSFPGASSTLSSLMNPTLPMLTATIGIEWAEIEWTVRKIVPSPPATTTSEVRSNLSSWDARSYADDTQVRERRLRSAIRESISPRAPSTSALYTNPMRPIGHTPNTPTAERANGMPKRASARSKPRFDMTVPTTPPCSMPRR